MSWRGLIQLADRSEGDRQHIATLAAELDLPWPSPQPSAPAAEAPFCLEYSSQGLRLLDQRGKKPLEIFVDFCAGSNAHRAKYGGGKSQSIARAVGLGSACKPRVLDATAGYGKDAFVLASLGCEVCMLERSPVSYVLLRDGLQRARRHVEENGDMKLQASLARLHLLPRGDAIEYLRAAECPGFNVIYLDPMFPQRRKSAQVKKDMLALQALAGKDEDAAELLQLALRVAENRVVVKRPGQAPFLGLHAPSYQLPGKSARFDIYSKKKF